MGGPNRSQRWDWYRVNGSAGSKKHGSKTRNAELLWITDVIRDKLYMQTRDPLCVIGRLELGGCRLDSPMTLIVDIWNGGSHRKIWMDKPSLHPMQNAQVYFIASWSIKSNSQQWCPTMQQNSGQSQMGMMWKKKNLYIILPSPRLLCYYWGNAISF